MYSFTRCILFLYSCIRVQVGNKGGLAIKFSLLKHSFCFVNAHLAAHQHKVEARHRDWNKIEEVACFHEYVCIYIYIYIYIPCVCSWDPEDSHVPPCAGHTWPSWKHASRKREYAYMHTYTYACTNGRLSRRRWHHHHAELRVQSQRR